MSRAPYIKSRIFFATLFAGLGVPATVEGVTAPSIGVTLIGVGMILMSVHSFFVPIDLRQPLGRNFLGSQPAPIGPPRVRMLLTLAAFVCLLAGQLFELPARL